MSTNGKGLKIYRMEVIYSVNSKLKTVNTVVLLVQKQKHNIGQPISIGAEILC